MMHDFRPFAAMVDALAAKIAAWEKDRGIEFAYDGVSFSYIIRCVLWEVNLYKSSEIQ